MNSTGVALGTFILAAWIVVLAGVQLTRAADVIAAETRAGQLWVGSTLLAFATSLPELTTDVSAILMDVPNLAAGDLFGSNMANMLILAMLALSPSGSGLFARATVDHALGAALAIALAAIAGILVLSGPAFMIGRVDAGSLVLAVTYALGARTMFVRGSVAVATVVHTEVVGTEGKPQSRAALRRAYVRFAIAAAVILIVAPMFASAAKRLADVSGLGTTLVGTWLVGLATSLPELATSLAAVRTGAYDLAVGNLFGSNALNMVIFVPLDLLRPGSIFAALDGSHALSAMIGIVLIALALAAIVSRSRGRRSILVPGSLVIVAAYLMGMLLMYVNRGAT